MPFNYFSYLIAVSNIMLNKSGKNGQACLVCNLRGKAFKISTWIYQESIMLSAISQAKKDKYCIISIMWNLKNKTNEQTQNRNRLIDMEHKPVVARAKWGGRMGRIAEGD